MSTDLRHEALSILDEIPTAYVRLHVAVSGPKLKRGSGPRISGGTRNYVPINTEADEYADTMRDHIATLHHYVAETFGEHDAPSVSLQMAVEDLVRWSDLWTRLPNADRVVSELGDLLKRANRITGHDDEPQRLYTVCPGCLTVGEMYLTDNGIYGCRGCGSTWTPDGYAAAVATALSNYERDQAA